jgi:hypothetical protein
MPASSGASLLRLWNMRARCARSGSDRGPERQRAGSAAGRYVPGPSGRGLLWPNMVGCQGTSFTNSRSRTAAASRLSGQRNGLPVAGLLQAVARGNRREGRSHHGGAGRAVSAQTTHLARSGSTPGAVTTRRDAPDPSPAGLGAVPA